jgi:hypothetical protein
MHRLSRHVSKAVPATAIGRGRWWPLALVALATSSLASVAAAQSAHVIVQTDTSWVVTGAAPAAGWNTSLAFDVSAWAAAQVDAVAQPVGTHVTDRIWDSTDSLGGSSVIWVRKRFTLPGPAISAILDAAVDDDVQLWVNGTRVIDNADCLASEILGTDIQPYLVPGENLIAAMVTNCQYSHTFGAYADVGADAAAVPTLGTPGLIAMAAGLGLAGLLVIRRLVR